ncbi:regulatory protein NosR [Salipiger pallidus]|uniref:Regulatory protein NosR n=1 Tax=Salipiger pallidus TaxID=1775170 RepID=A0A8J2ZJS9_9RHOB|nr:4Fe-4S binding protein [Salipiger pallidus]GGG73439.1 regulatory protein NosR [Salipiger pallidus]
MQLFLALLLCLTAFTARAEPLDRAAMERFVYAPYALGEPVSDDGVWELLNSGGALAGYALETGQIAPLPGFSGAPINLFVMMDLEGQFLNVRLIEHNEPIFVSGLGEAPFRGFLEQYAGHSVSQGMVVGQGDDASGLVHLDGVTKATASVRIAHESLMAATREIAREKLGGVSAGPPARPDPDHDEALDWDALTQGGIATHAHLTNAEADALFASTVWADDDPEGASDPQGAYLDLWVVDIGPRSIARAVLSEDTLAELDRFLAISPDEEPLLLIETGRHGLVSDAFIRNTAPDRLAAQQDSLPIALRDADLLVDLSPDLPEALHDGTAMILRTDRRLGFDPSRDWTLTVEVVREHGMFQPQIGRQEIDVPVTTPERFFLRPEPVRTLPPWREAIRARQADLLVLGAFLALMLLAVGPLQRRMAGMRGFTAIRLTLLAAMTGFVGFWGQGQLSVVTPLAVLRTGLDGGSFAFLLYDPFSLMVWAAAAIGFVLWGRGFFCGWLCPFGALQEFAAHLGRQLRLPQIEPSPLWDKRLKWLKYAVLGSMILTVFVAPARIDTVAEFEPFKTAITTVFLRAWPFVLWAAGLLVLSMVLFKGFCRYLCPLGAVMAIGGLLRGRDWIARREDCGSPCQLCRVRCRYGAIEKTGKIDYSECFQCLDCVQIHDDPQQCVPLVLAGRQVRRATNLRPLKASPPAE